MAARCAAKRIFDVMVAREIESKRQINEVAKINKMIVVSPDIANLMPSSFPKNNREKVIGISVSHEIIRQWKSDESYYDCITNLIHYIQKNMEINIMLIPNDIKYRKDFNDATVANNILSKIHIKSIIRLLDVSKISSTELKREIGGCEILVGSRYHSCVASLSSIVPTLAIGWHHKYEELLTIYGQKAWYISNTNCSSHLLISKFESLWNNRNREKRIIKSNVDHVRNEILNTARIMFAK